MRIKRIVSRHRRDIWIILECEHCGVETDKTAGYDDAHYHQKVVPAMACKAEGCGKTASDDYLPIATKYSPEETV